MVRFRVRVFVWVRVRMGKLTIVNGRTHRCTES